MTINEVMLLIISPIVTMIVGGIIGIMSGKYLGRKEKELEYVRIQKSLRDEKLLEGKISTYHKLFEMIGEIQMIIRKCRNDLRQGYIEEYQKTINEFLKDRREYTRKSNAIFFYCNDNVRIAQLDFFRLFSEFDKLFIDELFNKGQITNDDIKKINKLKLKVANKAEILRVEMKKDIGFNHVT
jgi:hypothetical protein